MIIRIGLLLITVLSSQVCKLDTVRYNEVESLSFFEQKVQENQRNNSSILLIFDIDDTLLTSTSFVGGDVWYAWQNGHSIEFSGGGNVIIEPSDQTSCVFSELGLYYELGTFESVEESTTEIVNRLRESYDTLVLTSRSPNYRAGTERELIRAGLDSSSNHFLPSPQSWSYSLDSRDISYEDGIVMSTGADKGRVTIDFLEKLNEANIRNNVYTDIFFIDDGYRNIEDMARVFEYGSNTTAHLFHYVHVDKRVSELDMQLAKSARAAMDSFLKIAFPDRFELLQSGFCD